MSERLMQLEQLVMQQNATIAALRYENERLRKLVEDNDEVIDAQTKLIQKNAIKLEQALTPLAPDDVCECGHVKKVHFPGETNYALGCCGSDCRCTEFRPQQKGGRDQG